MVTLTRATAGTECLIAKYFSPFVSFVIFVVNEIKMIVPGCPQGSLKTL